MLVTGCLMLDAGCWMFLSFYPVSSQKRPARRRQGFTLRSCLRATHRQTNQHPVSSIIFVNPFALNDVLLFPKIQALN
jgi:hypothetical protein